MDAYVRLWPPMGFEGTIRGGAAYVRLWPPMAAYVRLWPPMGFEGTIGGGAAYVRLWPPMAAYVRLWPFRGILPVYLGLCGPHPALTLCSLAFVYINKRLYTVRSDP
jgi:hypothetical protein